MAHYSLTLGYEVAVLFGRQLLKYFLIISLVILPQHPLRVNAAPSRPALPSQLQYFITTESVASQMGPAHLEIQNFEINSPAELAEAQAAISGKMSGTQRVSEFFTLNVQSRNYRINSLEVSFQNSVREIKNSVSADHISEQPTTVVEPPRGNIFKRNYNLTLGLVRGVVNGATVFAGLVIGKGIPMEHAALIGVLAGAISGGIQIKNEFFFKWLGDSVSFVNQAKRLRLIPDTDGADPSRAERILKEAVMYSKWASMEAAFLLVIQTSMAMLNVPITEGLLSTVLKSTASQGVYDVGTLKIADQFESINPRWARHTQTFKNIAAFGGSAISVLAAIGAMVGVPFANYGFVVLAGAGLVFNVGARVTTKEPVQRFIQRIATRRAEATRAREARVQSQSRPAVRLQCRVLVGG
jgi:hypothetical protein